MFVTLRRVVVTEGYADKMIEKYGKPGIVARQKGFVDITPMKQKARRGREEVIILTRWESETDWKRWEQSDAHIDRHKARVGKLQPEYIISHDMKEYEIQKVE